MTAPTSHVATLVSNPASPALDDAVLADVVRALGPMVSGAPRWLDWHIAADIPLDPPPQASIAGLVERIRASLGAAPADIIVQRRAGRRKMLLLADMDSTLIGQECIDELADFAGLKAEVAAITERAMRGETAFDPALRQRVALLRGLEESIVAKVIAERITLTPGGRTLVATMRGAGAHTALVSGGFTSFTGHIAEAIGFHEHRANVLLVEDGRFAGRVTEPILGREAKLASLIELRERHGLTREATLAVGDGANDLAMLGEAGLGIAFHAKPVVAAAAHARVDHADLTALLYAQGYRREDFVA